MLSRPRTLPAGFILPCLPTKAPRPPSGGLWLHEIKHDGFRVIARKDGERMRLYSRPGNDLQPKSQRREPDRDVPGAANDLAVLAG
jgi:ATP-dependent DNA ligase